jgi:hypothetical protein
MFLVKKSVFFVFLFFQDTPQSLNAEYIKLMTENARNASHVAKINEWKAIKEAKIVTPPGT